MSSKILFIWEAHCLAASNFSPVPRNDTVWGDFGQGVQADTGVQLVRVELSIFGVRTLSYLIGQPRYGLVFCDVVLHTFFCGLSLDSIS